MFTCMWPLERSFEKDGEKVTYLGGRFGSYSKFGNRYCGVEANEHGKKYVGINPLFEDELRDRMTGIMTRVTKEEVAHLLPPLTTQRVRLYVNEGQTYSQSLLDDEKVKETVSAALRLKAEGASHIAIVTHHVQMAKDIASKLDKENVVLVTGEVPQDKRKDLIDGAAADENAILVVTIKSVGIGINNLVTFDQVLFAEIHPSPEKMLQMLGRWCRLNSKKPVTVQFLVFDDTAEDHAASRLVIKIEAANAVLKAGKGENALTSSLGGLDSNWLEDLASVAEDMDFSLDGELA